MRSTHTFLRAAAFVLALCLILSLVATTLVGCDTASDPAGDGILTVVATTFTGYDMARQLLKDMGSEGVEVVLLGKPGQDMHSFEPTAADITTLSRADVLVCLGDSAEAWLPATLRSAMNESVTRVDMMAVCQPLSSTPTPGMDTDHDHDGHDHGDGDTCGLIGTDEHVWLAPSNAIAIATALSQALSTALTAANADDPRLPTLQVSTANYLSTLVSLRDDYAALGATAVRNTILVADRYPFAYLVRELNLTAYAAFPGCSSETSASFATQTSLIEKTKELKLPYIFVLEGSDGQVASVIAAETGAEVLTLNSIQVVTDLDATYVGLMEKNLENLQKALCE